MPGKVRALLDAKFDRLRDELLEAVASRPQRRLIDTGELAAGLGVTGTTVRKLRASGMPTIMVSESARYDFDAVLAWLQSRSGGAK